MIRRGVSTFKQDRAANRRNAAGRVATAQPERTAVREESLDREEVARVAYGLWESRGRTHGRDFDDWIEAVRIVRSKRANRS